MNKKTTQILVRLAAVIVLALAITYIALDFIITILNADNGVYLDVFNLLQVAVNTMVMLCVARGLWGYREWARIVTIISLILVLPNLIEGTIYKFSLLYAPVLLCAIIAIGFFSFNKDIILLFKQPQNL
jgi:hypothetical protein